MTQVTATDLPRHPQRLDDAVPDGVGECGLEPVEALVEPARRAIVLTEPQERRPQLA